jgi:hypothetical protein
MATATRWCAAALLVAALMASGVAAQAGRLNDPMYKDLVDWVVREGGKARGGALQIVLQIVLQIICRRSPISANPALVGQGGTLHWACRLQVDVYVAKNSAGYRGLFAGAAGKEGDSVATIPSAWVAQGITTSGIRRMLTHPPIRGVAQ